MLNVVIVYIAKDLQLENLLDIDVVIQSLLDTEINILIKLLENPI